MDGHENSDFVLDSASDAVPLAKHRHDLWLPSQQLAGGVLTIPVSTAVGRTKECDMQRTFACAVRRLALCSNGMQLEWK